MIPYAQNFYYDPNGNLIIDKHQGIAANNNRGLHFYYDERNLPVQIGDFRYRYTADGQRYYKEVFGKEEYYLMDAELSTGVFSSEGAGFELDYWNILGHGVEGRYEPGNGYRYYYKDHLGSTRVVVNASGTILDATDYYPFGLAMPGRSHTTAPGTKEMFTGHERDDELELDYMVARRYNPALGRFLSVDPLAHKIPGWSPYVYAANNPLIFIDPDGREWLTAQDERMGRRLQNLMGQRVNQLERQNARLERRLERAEASGNERRAERISGRIADNQEQIHELNAGISEIQHLGDTEDFVFTFTETQSSSHHVRLLENPDDDRPLISLEYSSTALAAHEARHAYQYITGGMLNGSMAFRESDRLMIYTSLAAMGRNEISAYRLQYSLNSNSLPRSPRRIGGINSEWLCGIPGNPYGCR